jgi:hypothetical protein
MKYKLSRNIFIFVYFQNVTKPFLQYRRNTTSTQPDHDIIKDVTATSFTCWDAVLLTPDLPV